MEARTMSLPPAASHDDAERCLLAIELSKKSWIVALNPPLSDKISRYTLKPCDWKELSKLSERVRTRVAGELKKRVDVVSCYEAGYDSFWLHRLLEAHWSRSRGEAIIDICSRDHKVTEPDEISLWRAYRLFEVDFVAFRN